MKNLILISILCITSVFQVSAQNLEGEVDFKITYKNIPEELIKTKPMFPKKAKVIIKNHHSKFIQSNMFGKMKIISNSKTQKSTVLIKVMGKKIAYTNDSLKSDSTYTLTKLEKTKVIAGYTCKKAVLTNSINNTKLVMWYTSELPSYYNTNIPTSKLNGFIMETIIKRNGMTATMTAYKITKKTIKDSEFVIPKGYDVKTKKEINEMFLGKM